MARPLGIHAISRQFRESQIVALWIAATAKEGGSDSTSRKSALASSRQDRRTLELPLAAPCRGGSLVVDEILSGPHPHAHANRESFERSSNCVPRGPARPPSDFLVKEPLLLARQEGADRESCSGVPSYAHSAARRSATSAAPACMVAESTPYILPHAERTSGVKSSRRPRSSVQSNASPTIL